MAFWGIETNYGTYMGDFRVVCSVATLACMTKRREFFSNETVPKSLTLNTNHMTSDWMRGLWAGAMGNMQFMPSTFTKRAVDRDGNGKIDIWFSVRRLRLGGELPARHRLQAGPAVQRRSDAAGELPARPGRHDGRGR